MRHDISSKSVFVGMSVTFQGSNILVFHPAMLGESTYLRTRRKKQIDLRCKNPDFNQICVRNHLHLFTFYMRSITWVSGTLPTQYLEKQRFAVFARPNFSLADKQEINGVFNSFTAGRKEGLQENVSGVVTFLMTRGRLTHACVCV